MRVQLAHVLLDVLLAFTLLAYARGADPVCVGEGCTCARWCKLPDDHCPNEACRDCSMCNDIRSRVACTPNPAQKNDLPYEACKPWCNPLRYPDLHCGICSCKGCDSCKALLGKSAAAPKAASALAAEAATASAR